MPRRSSGSRSKIIAGVNLLSRSASYARSGRWAKKGKRKPVAAKPTTAPTPVTKQFGKGTRTIQPKAPRWYPTERVPRPLLNHKKPRTARLRKSITPGTILILLAGRFRGRRVVFLKQLPSGLLLITGPYKINGVPLRRVNQAYVIATSTKVDVSQVKIPDTVNDKFFAKTKTKNVKSGETLFQEKTEEKKAISPERVAAQKAVDDAVVAAVRKDPLLARYLKVKFSLSKGQYPHEMKF